MMTERIFIQTILVICFILLLFPKINTFELTSVNEKQATENTDSFKKTYIGIMSQPATIWNKMIPGFSKHNSYIATSYMKYTEQTGAQSLLIPWDLPWEELTELLEQTNGLVFPGGAAELVDEKGNVTEYMERLTQIMDWAIKKNENGYWYSLLGECLGLEEMMIGLAGNNSTMLEKGFEDENYVHSIKVNKRMFVKSAMYGLMQKKNAFRIFKEEKIFFNHGSGISPKLLKSNPVIGDEIEIVGTSVPANGKTFVTLLQHKKYPFYAVQPHPEKNQWEKSNPAINNILDRSRKTIDVTSDFMKSFVELTSKKRHVNIDEVGLSEKASSYKAYNFLTFPDMRNVFEGFYLFNNMSKCGSKCSEEIASESYQDSVYQTYRKLKLVKQRED